MYKTALIATALVFSTTALGAEEYPNLPRGEFHKIATTYSEAEQEFSVDAIPAKAFTWIKAVYANDFRAPAIENATAVLLSKNTQISK